MPRTEIGRSPETPSLLIWYCPPVAQRLPNYRPTIKHCFIPKLDQCEASISPGNATLPSCRQERVPDGALGCGAPGTEIGRSPETPSLLIWYCPPVAQRLPNYRPTIKHCLIPKLNQRKASISPGNATRTSGRKRRNPPSLRSGFSA